ncbi:PucR family transcriptional regulator [Mobilicoccus caccae]|uniref:PucR family transcriptional regulator n=1 Tax=Mobilicoccus caccae TaxID=1859295 RepID=A0ABQ6INN6_9MICO|nr:helix-turn-helix domain-containing protein [Mobilicoccus caccae]GMA39356.1 PucR family transcriptional regulator [Mobilicoccus caccae]
MSEARCSEETVARLERSIGTLTTAANGHLESTLDWYGALPAAERSWVSVVAHTGIASFVRWCRGSDDITRLTSAIFGAAPTELTRSISLPQTLDLIRGVLEVVESRVDDLASPGDEAAFTETILRFSREVAFAAAHVYAFAYERRGAWDARLESLVVDALVRGDGQEDVALRANALGWGDTAPVLVVVGRSPQHADVGMDALRRTAERARISCLLGVQGRTLIAVLGGEGVREAADGVAAHFGDGPVVVGPVVPRLFAAGRSARAALSGLLAAPAWAAAPRVVDADDLLPERALLGEKPARTMLVERTFTPLHAAGGELVETVTAYLDAGRGLEATARAMYVHANTVRYRLGRVAQLIGLDPTVPREAHVLATGLALGRLAPSEARFRRMRPTE